MTLFDDRLCLLGEGPLWHPEREQLFWFDILGRQLLTRYQGTPKFWTFDEYVSAAGWIDRDHLLVASESALFVFDIETGERGNLCALEDENAGTRSNDGRADPFGGFWISTMGKSGEKGQAGIYRYFRGELRQLYKGLTIPNTICFAPDGQRVYFADTARHCVSCAELDDQGWPCADPGLFLDFADTKRNPDGAVTDRDGNVWIAFWGLSCIDVFGSDGRFLRSFDFPVSQVSCPAFGGSGYSTLFATSARVDLSDSALAAEPKAGAVFALETGFQGLPEYKVIL